MDFACARQKHQLEAFPPILLSALDYKRLRKKGTVIMLTRVVKNTPDAARAESASYLSARMLLRAKPTGIARKPVLPKVHKIRKAASRIIPLVN